MSVLAALLLPLSACSGEPEGEILAIGDSFLAWNMESGGSIPEVAAEELNKTAVNDSISGSLFLEGEEAIPSQWWEGDWEWLILNGGGNDLEEGCGCGDCDAVMSQLISEDGQDGEIPELIDTVTSQGISVAFVGYMDLPPEAEDFQDCADELETLRERLQEGLADRPSAIFVDPSERFGAEELEHYDDDLIHPSEEGSRRIGEQVAEAIRDAGG